MPAANPPMTPVTKSRRVTFPLSGRSTAIFSAKMKSFALDNNQAFTIQNKAIAKKGTKKVATFRKRTIAPLKNAASITAHQGKKMDKMIPKRRVNMKFEAFFIF